MNLFELAATLKLSTTEFENGIKSAKLSAAVFAKDMTKGQSNLGQGMSNLGKGLVNIGNRVTQFGKGVVSVGKTASIVTAGVGTVLGMAFNKAKSYIATYESAMTTFSHSAQIGEEGAQALYDALLNVAQRSAYAREVFFSAGQALVSMGLDANDTTKYVQAFTDITAKMGKPASNIEELADLFGKLSMQTNLYTRDIQQMVTAGIPAWNILATHYHKTTDEVKKMASDGLIPAKESLDVVTDALEETNKESEMFQYSAAGMANALKQGTLTGALDSLDSSFRNFSTTLLGLDPATDEGKQNIASLNKTILAFGETMKSVGKKFSFIGDWIRTGLQNITAFLEKFNQALDNMPQEQAQAIAKTIAIIAAMGPILVVVGTAIVKIGTAISGLGTLCEWLAPVVEGASGAWAGFAGAVGGVGAACGIVAAAVVALIAIFIVVKENWDKIVAAFSDWYEKSGLRENIDNLSQKFSELGAKIGGLHDFFVALGTILSVVLLPAVISLQAAFAGLVTFFDGLVTFLSGIIDMFAGLGEVIVGIFTGDWDKVKEGFNKILVGLLELALGFYNMFFESINTFFSNIWTAISSWLDNLGITEWFNNLWNSYVTWAAGLLSNIIAWLMNIWSSITGWCSNVWNSIVQWLANIVNNVSQKFQELQNKVREIWERIKTAIMTPINNAYNTVRSVVDRIKSTVSNVFNSVKSTVINVWNSIKSSISNTINSIRDNVSSVFNSVKSTVSNIWNGITGTISSAINSAKDAVWGAIDRIKSFFNFSISWPHIPLPHFSISPAGWQIGDLLQGSIPSLNIAWYAKGGIFTKPTLFPTANGFNGVGEAGAEAVLPIETLRGYIVDAMAEGVREAQVAYKDSNSAKANSGMVNALMSAIQNSEKEINVYIGGKQIVSEIYKPLMDTMRKKEVSVGA